MRGDELKPAPVTVTATVPVGNGFGDTELIVSPVGMEE
jgi:hypothetical protein